MEIRVHTITVDQDFKTIFSEEILPQHARSGMILTDQIEALNLRIRTSEAGYQTGWHVAGDPALIIVQEGTLRITLRDGIFKDFSAGDQFIARDYLPEDLAFNETHGHRAEVIGGQDLRAVHVKLGKL